MKTDTELKKVKAQVISFANSTILAINESFPVFKIPFTHYKDLNSMCLGDLIDLYVDADNKAYLTSNEVVDRLTPVEAKTAEEIKKVILSKIKELKTFMHNEDDLTIRGNYYVSIQHMYGLIRDFDAQFTPSAKSVEVEEQTPKWQLCPKCNGSGEMYINNLYKNQTTGIIGLTTCDVCGGAKIIATPNVLSLKQAETISRLEEENQVLRSAINQDKTGLAKGLADVRKLLEGYRWICEGRGPYAWNDERYKKEVLTMLNDIEKVSVKALRESGELATKAFHFRVAKEALKEKE